MDMIFPTYITCAILEEVKDICLAICFQNTLIKGSILELESVTKNKDLLWTSKMGVENRFTYVIGDMFNEVPPTDAYIMKMILHD
jgi:hypothetical protein